jgi:hypothetical protein
VKNLSLLIVAMVLLAGCVQRPYIPQMTPAQSARENSVNTVNSALSRVTACSEGLRETKPAFDGDKRDLSLAPSVNLVDKEVLFAKDSDPNKVMLMSSTAKISTAQRKALLDYIQANQKCRAIIRNELGGYPALVTVYENYYGDTDIMYSKLISKEITIGEANRQKAQLLAKLKTEYTSATGAMNDRYNAQINQEVQAAQADAAQRRAIAAQFLMNQQNINAAQQMNNQNQLNNQIMNNKPVTTNCNKFGNQVNCTSY